MDYALGFWSMLCERCHRKNIIEELYNTMKPKTINPLFTLITLIK